MKYDVTNKTQANRVIYDMNGKQVMIEVGKTRSGVELSDSVAARLQADGKKFPEVSLSISKEDKAQDISASKSTAAISGGQPSPAEAAATQKIQPMPSQAANYDKLHPQSKK